MKNKIIIPFIFLMFFGCKERTETDIEQKINRFVLSESNYGEEFFFRIPSNEIVEYKVSYLGDIKTSKQKILKFITNVSYIGATNDNKKATGALYIYDSEDNELGFYYVGGALDVPTKIENQNVLFKYNNTRCNQTTSINFKDSIPSQIFVACTKNGGDVYTFTTPGVK